jgi:hypothetical protein
MEFKLNLREIQFIIDSIVCLEFYYKYALKFSPRIYPWDRYQKKYQNRFNGLKIKTIEMVKNINEYINPRLKPWAIMKSKNLTYIKLLITHYSLF